MRRGDVANVGREAVARIEGVEPPHEAVSCDLGDDRGSRDGGALRVPVDDRRVGRRERAQAEAVDEARLRGRVELVQDDAKAPEVRAMEPSTVDLAGRDDANGYP